MYNKVFISYASEDVAKALEVYEYLANRNYIPWLDKKKLKVGDNWNLKIRHALKESDFIILLLSSNSVNKRGYVQREFKLALDYLNEKLDTDTYLLPVLLDECNIPYQLESIQWGRYTEENLMEEIREVLERQRKIYFEYSTPNTIELHQSYITEKVELPPPLTKYFNSTIEYPVFAQNRFWDFNYVNEIIKGKVHQVRNSLMNFYFEDPDFFRDVGEVKFATIDFNYSIRMISENALSLLFTEDSYYHGTAHPNTKFHTLNFLFNPDYVINPEFHFTHDEIKSIVANKKFMEDAGLIEDMPDFDFSPYVENPGYNLEFVMETDKVELIIANNLPRAIFAAGFYSVPYKIDKHKITLMVS